LCGHRTRVEYAGVRTSSPTAVATKQRTSSSSRPRNVVAAARVQTPRQRYDWRKFVREFGPLLLAWLVVHTFVLQAFRIPSESMEPTLLVGDFLFVNPAYNVELPIPGVDVRLFSYGEPKRNGIAIYKSPDARDGNPTVVKRLVGVGGDTLYMRNGQLYVNGIEQRLPLAPEPPPLGGPEEFSPDFDWQKRVALTNSRFGPAPARPTHDNWGPLVIPPNHFFSLGDNRYNSKDARFYGFIPRDNVRGRPLFIYLSLDLEAWSIRWNRIGQRIR